MLYAISISIFLLSMYICLSFQLPSLSIQNVPKSDLKYSLLNRASLRRLLIHSSNMGNDISDSKSLPELDTFMRIMRKVDKLRKAGTVNQFYIYYYYYYYYYYFNKTLTLYNSNLLLLRYNI